MMNEAKSLDTIELDLNIFPVRTNIPNLIALKYQKSTHNGLCTSGEIIAREIIAT